jgi:predicted RNase H-like nuclease (RuvC/YqgF family)
MSTMTSEHEKTEHEHRMDLEEVRKQVMTYGKEIHDYFDHMNHLQAEVENYKFSVEKHGEGIEVEVQLKAYVHPKKPNDVSKIIPK